MQVLGPEGRGGTEATVAARPGGGEELTVVCPVGRGYRRPQRRSVRMWTVAFWGIILPFEEWEPMDNGWRLTCESPPEIEEESQ